VTEVNWAGTHTYVGAVRRPASIEEVRDVVGAATAAGRRVRALGTRHSFNAVADVDGTLLDMGGLPHVIEVDPGARHVVVSGGTTYGVLAQALHAQGWALHNLASLPHISVAGAVATGTHGSGDRNGNLATAVTAMELVTADGDLRWIARESGAFDGAVVSLGCLGIVTRVRLTIEPTYDVRQWVHEGVAMATVAGHLDEMFSAAYSVSAFTDWREAQVWVKSREGDGWSPTDRWLGGAPAGEERHPIPGTDPVNCTAQLGVPGPWFDRLPHFRIGFVPSAGDEIQSEYFVSRTHAPAALRVLVGLVEQIRPVLHVSEIRTIAGDGLWMSGTYGGDAVGIHFTWRKLPDAVARVRDAVEEALRPFAPRPHWGKTSGIPAAEVAARYRRHGDFCSLVERFDPTGTFANDHTGPFLAA
jgi:alditol oxidase